MNTKFWGYALIGVGLAFGIESVYNLFRIGFRWQEGVIAAVSVVLIIRGFKRVLAAREASQ